MVMGDFIPKIGGSKMTDSELTAIRSRAEKATGLGAIEILRSQRDVPVLIREIESIRLHEIPPLLAEVDRLKAENASLRDELRENLRGDFSNLTDTIQSLQKDNRNAESTIDRLKAENVQLTAQRDLAQENAAVISSELEKCRIASDHAEGQSETIKHLRREVERLEKDLLKTNEDVRVQKRFFEAACRKIAKSKTCVIGDSSWQSINDQINQMSAKIAVEIMLESNQTETEKGGNDERV